MTEHEPGRHVVNAIPAGSYDVISHVPYKERAIASIVWRGSAAEDFRVNVGLLGDLVGGVVLRADGQPVADAVVVPDRKNNPRVTEAYWCTTDTQGRFMFARAAGAPQGEPSFLITDDLGRAGVADSRLPSELRWGEIHQVIRVEPRGALEVRMVDGAGKPIDEFTVKVSAKNDCGVFSTSETARAGLARLRGLPTGKANLLLVPFGQHTPVWLETLVAPDGSGRAVVEVGLAAPLEGEVVFLGSLPSDRTDKAVVSIAPVDRDAAGETGFIVDDREPELEVQGAVEQKRFRFFCNPKFRYRLKVEAKGWRPFECFVEAGQGAFGEVTATLEPLSSIRARVIPPDALEWLKLYEAQQLPGLADRCGSFSACCTQVSRNRDDWNRPGILGSDGVLEFGNLCRGTWLLRLADPLGRGRLLRQEEVQSVRTVEISPIDLEFLRPCRVQGMVRCGEPDIGLKQLCAMAVGGGRLDVLLHDDGGFEFDAPAGTYRFGVVFVDEGGSSGMFRDARQVVVNPGRTTRVDLHVEMRRLRLRVVGQAGELPAAGVSLSIDEERDTMAFRTFESDATGFAEIYPCPPGEFGVSFMDPQSRRWISVARVLGDSSNPVLIRLPR